MTRSVAYIGLGLAVLSACSGVGNPPPGWFQEPISRANYCSAKTETPEPIAERPEASIQQGLDAVNAEVARCQREALARNSGAYGTMKIKFWITPEGTVSNACIDEATFDDDPMARCMMRAVEAVRVEPAQGYQVVTRPFWFQLQAASYTDFPEPPHPVSVEEQTFPRGSGVY